MQHPAGTRTQRMDGFGDAFIDIVDYIYRVTHRIWVERALDLIGEHYDQDCTVYSQSGVTIGVSGVMAGTAAMIDAFPDRESHFLNVAWSGNDRDGFYTSHLGFSRMVNRGATAYGRATGRSVLIRTTADCISRNDRIHTEWLVRDTGALVRQLGFDRHQVACRLAAMPERERMPAAHPGRQASPVLSDAPSGTVEGFAAAMLHDIWTRRRLDRIDTLYAPDAVAHSGGGVVALGRRAISQRVIAILAGLPDAVARVDNVCWSEERDGTIVAVRWVLKGTTRSGGFLHGAPADQPVTMLVISHFRFVRGRIAEEWTVFDEVALLTQIYRMAEESVTSETGMGRPIKTSG